MDFLKTPKLNREEIRKNSLTVPMSEEEKKRVKKAAHDMGVSMSSFARIALNEFVKRGCL